jgi:uncharacterized protein (DUF362 family)
VTILISDGKGTLRDILQAILDAFITDADCARGILIKPNIVFPVKPASGEITSPLLVRTLISALRERWPGIDIVIGEGVAAGCDPQENFQVSGYAGLASELNVPLLDLHSVERVAVAWKFGELELPRLAFERTYINLPILKPSSACVISGALKNQKGLVLPDVKKKFHCLGLHEQLAELNAVVRPALTILDGSHFFGRKTFISGNNCGEIDAEVCSLLGIDEPEHVKLSRSARLFAPGYTVRGGKIRSQRAAARLHVKESKQLGRLRLWSNPRACTMCRYLFREIKQDAFRPGNLSAKMSLLAYSIKGAEIVMGSRPDWRKEYGTVICIGNCARRVAKENGSIFIPGCPPTLQDLYENLRKEAPVKKSGKKGSG